MSNIHISGVTMTDVKTAIGITGQYGEHPDETYDPNALPLIDMITMEDIEGANVERAGLVEGIQGANFTNICLSNVQLNVTSNSPWKCSYVQGFSNCVIPESCEALRNPAGTSSCYIADHLDRCSSVQIV